MWPDRGRGNVHPDAAQGRGEEDYLRLGQSPHYPRGHGGEDSKHDDDVVIDIEVVENGDKDSSSKVTNKILLNTFPRFHKLHVFYNTWIML